MHGIVKRRSRRQCEGGSDARKDHMFVEGHTDSFLWCCETDQIVLSYSKANRKGLDSQENSSAAAQIANDYGEWPARISDNIRQILVEQDDKGRRFTLPNYHRKLTNGEEIQREWLLYFIRQNSIFCFCCKLFSNEKISVTSASGFSD
ncbi:hypothetical protein PR048_018622 [Dryococelus australis]|uniref:Uncharacterized protein n=1 Tax=Dryococelus australis TaxID=614101 RepID=A0ABQ9HCZ5_9NEOP|nr:hypothetical protein PR048_018622 [Dryococelus australis]